MGPRRLRPALEVLASRYFERRLIAGDWDAGEWVHAVSAALSERLGPALGEAARATGAALPRPCWVALTAATLGNERRFTSQAAALDQLAPEFERRGVSPLIFKGLAQARHYPTPEIREASDVDLLVAPAWMAVVDEVLLGAGFERARSGGEVGATPYAVVYARPALEGETITLEVHPAWHEVTLSESGDRTLVGSASERVARTQIARAEWGVLAPAAELYLSAAHVVLHNPRTLSVYLDLAILLDRADEGVLDRAAAFARENGRERHLRHALTMAADLFDLELGREFLSLQQRIGVPATVRLGYLGKGLRYLPSSLVLELLWRRGFRRKLEFARWVLGQGETPGSGAPGGPRRLRRLVRTLRGLRWLSGVMLRYRVALPQPLQSNRVRT